MNTTTLAGVGDAVLLDGATVGVRPVRPEDEAGLATLLEGLSSRSRYLRFFSCATDLAEAARMAAGLPGSVAVTGAPERIVGHALYAPDGAGGAEVAFEVADEWHGRGVATLLLGAVSESAAAAGIGTLTALVLPDNHAMVGVFRASGFPVEVHAHPGELTVELGTALGPEATARFGERERAGAVAALQHFLAPASVAVVAAGTDPGSIGSAIVANLRSSFDGPIHPIARGQSVLDVDGPVELAIVAVPAAAVEAVARDCAAKGVAALLVVSAGFEDAPGRARRDRLAAFCRAAGMRLIGPNCLGVMGPRINATCAGTRPHAGRVGLISQSGGIGIAALEQGRSHGLGLSAFVSIGDRGDISSNDVIQWCEQDAGTHVIALYLESFGNPRRFARIARRVTRHKPIVAVKAGRSATGARAAGSHTGALVAASDATVDALFAQAGVVRTDTYRELLDVAALLAAGPAPAGPRLGVVTNAGGPAVLLADAADAAGLVLPDPSPETVRAVRAGHPGAAVANPLDVLGDAGADRLRAAVAAAAADPAFDALAVAFVPTFALDAEAAARAIADGLAGSGRPAVAVFLTGDPPPARLRAAGIPVVGFPEDAARALAAAARYGAARARPASPPVVPQPSPCRDEAAAVLARALATGSEWLDPGAVAQLARCYGLPLAAARRVRAPSAAGVELLVGVASDPRFGPVMAVAAGGTAAELRADAAIRLAPLSERDVHEMPRALSTFPLLDGRRGAPRADVAALEDVLRRVSALADDQPAIAELDCNPVVVAPGGATIVEMRVRVHTPAPRAPVGTLQAR